MTTTKKRAETLRVLIDGHGALKSSSRLTDITGEVSRIVESSKSAKPSGWLLSVLYTTRVLDTSVHEILDNKGWLGTHQSLGGYLICLQTHNVIKQNQVEYWQNRIVDKRNTYMHRAGMMPSPMEADAILAEMQACLTVVIGAT